MSPEITTDNPFVLEMFEYLDRLRESGKINMFGAGPVMEKAYGLDKSTARKVVARWMETFEERHA
ncbi:MAG: hypothetical protein VW443_04810 [Pseudomonadales bacterium]|jgi:hypothetical protein